MNKIIYSIFLLLAGIVNGTFADAFYFQEEFTVPVPPSNTNAEPISFSEISVSWDYDGDEKNINHFYVERVEGNVPFETAERLKYNKNVRSIVDENLQAETTYKYRVIASNPDSDSEPSNEAVATTLLLAPNPPSGLTAEASSATEIVLNWTHDGANYDGFRIESSSAASGPFTEIGMVSAGIFTFTHTDLIPATTYFYRVIALNGAEFSDPSGAVSATTEILATAPAAPSGLTATTVSSTQISLSWSDNSDNETGFVLERSETSASTGFVEIEVTASSITTFEDTGLAANTTYYYRIKARNAQGDSGYSSTSGKTSDVAPAAPSGLTVTSTTATSITLGWTDNSTNETGFVLERSETSASTGFVEIEVTATSVTSFEDTGLAANTTYYYRIKARNAQGDSGYSSTSGKTSDVAPAAPSGLTVTTTTATSITLGWTDNSTNETGFVLERSETSASTGFVEIEVTATSITSFEDTGLAANTTYYYRIKARNAQGDSGYSATSGKTSDVAPSAPSGLTVTTTTATSITLGWTDNSTNETGFVLERSETSASTGFVEIEVTATSITSFEDTGLAANTTYYYRIKARNAQGDSGYSSTSGKTSDVAPAAPSGLTITAKTANSISLGWTDNSTNETAFVLERSETSASTGFVEIRRTAANIISFEDTGLASNKTYYYRIKAVNSVGDSQYVTVSGKTNDLAPTPPSGLQITSKTATTIRLGWTDNSNNETGFILERSLTAGSGFTEIAETAANSTTYLDEGLTSNTTYYYRIRATNEIGMSSFSAVSGKTETDIPLTPSGLSATSVTTSSITLTWNDNSANETSFVLERSLQSTTGFTLVTELPANSETYTNTGLASNQTYFYRISAVNNDGASSFSNTASATTDRLAGPPSAPSQLVATSITTFQINLTWKDNSDNESSFTVERALNEGGPYTVIANLPSNSTFYENTGLSAGTTYYYRVKSKNIDGVGESNLASATTGLVPQPPAAPTALSAIATSTVQINLTWIDNSNSETYFIIQRATALNGPFELIASVGANVTSYQNFGLTANTNYYYRVRAENGDGASAYSNVDNAKTSQAPQPPSAPSSLSSEGVSTTQINLSWIDNSNSETGFVIERASSIDGEYFFVGSVGSNVQIFQNTGLIAGTEYFYKVRAINNDGTSGYSNISSARTLTQGKAPTPPTNLVAVGVSTTQINLSWEDNSVSETNFEVHRSTSENGVYSFLVNVSANQEFYENTGLQAGTTYYYKVRSSNGDGNSTFSNIATGTTSSQAQPPAAPDGLTALPVSTTQITLRWNDKALNETVYEIERSTEGGAFSLIGTVNANDTLFQNFGLSPDTEYSYRVRAQNGDGVSLYSNEATARTLLDKVPPLLPSDLFGKILSQNEVELFWTDNSENEEEFIIERAELETENQTTVNYGIIGILPSNTTTFLDTDVDANTIYKYRVQAKNSDGNTFSNEVIIITSISGNPIITTISIDYPKYFENASIDTTVSIKVAEPGLYSAVKFYYRGLASNLYKERVVDVNENLYAVSIVREDLDEMGLEYYFEAAGFDGQTYVSNVGRTYLSYEGSGLVLENLKFGEIVEDYQMISIPLDLDQKSIIRILEDDLGPYDPEKWRLFHFEDGDMLERGAFIDILPGKGYWLIMKEESQVNTGAGNVVEVSKNEPFELVLNQGWNQIGNPYMMNIFWEDVLVANGNPSILSDSLYTFNGSYRLADRLNVFQGGYVFAEKDTTIVIPLGSSGENNGGRYSDDNSKTNNVLDLSENWNLDIKLAADNITYNLAGLGMRENASDSKDRFDRIALPKFADYIDINFSHPEYFASDFTKDVVPLKSSFVWNMNVLSSQGKRPTTLSWSQDVGIPSGMNLVLFDVEKQRKVNMRERNSYVVSGEEVKLQIYYGNDDFIEHELKAYGVNIGSIYPNPFAENFVIPVALPNPNTFYNVKLHLFNSVGKTIKNDIEFTIGGGFHDLEVSHDHIKELAKGLYFYRLEVSYDGETLKERSGKIIKK